MSSLKPSRFDPSKPVIADCVYVLDGNTINVYAAQCVEAERAKHRALIESLNHLAMECNGIEGLSSGVIAHRLWAMIADARK